MRRLVLGAITAMTSALAACQKAPARSATTSDRFTDGAVVGELRGADLREVSGVVASTRHPGHYWMHNDSGGDPELVLVDSTGQAVMRLRVDGVQNRDWEDIAIRGDTVLIAEFGDNSSRHDTVFVYTVLEPARMADTTHALLGRYPMRYADGPRDAETLLADPRTGDWFIVTKREERVRLYRYPAPQRPDRLETIQRVGAEFPFRMVVAGDVSRDGSEILLKTYDAVYHWDRVGAEPIAETLARAPEALHYTPERQGEAIAFSLDGSSYVTASESELDSPQFFLRYRRQPMSR